MLFLSVYIFLDSINLPQMERIIGWKYFRVARWSWYHLIYYITMLVVVDLFGRKWYNSIIGIKGGRFEWIRN